MKAGARAAAAAGDPQAELAEITRILAHRPTDRAALYRLAGVGERLGDHAGVEQALRWLVQAHPDDTDGRLALAAALRRQGRAEEAAAASAEALSRRPGDPHARLEQALADEAAGRIDSAHGRLDALAAEMPGFAAGHLQRHYFHMRRGDAAAALAAAERLEAHHPDEPLGPVSRAVALHHLERFAEADAACRQVLARRPDFAPAHFTRGFNLLRMGVWHVGLAEFEWRHRLPGAPRPPLPLPQARLDDPPGTRVLVWSDQAVGDALQYLRFVPHLAAHGLAPVLHLPRALARLVQSLGADLSQEGERPVAADRQIALGSLPWLLGIEGPTGTWPGPYLAPPPDGPGLPPPTRPASLSAGIVWAGSPLHANDRARSMTVADLAPLFTVPGVAWYSLQLGRPDEVRPAGAIDVAPLIGDFADTAALLAGLDLLVTVDTSICHLAGALGVPTCLLLARRIDWRWIPGDGATGWYPSTIMFRQDHAGDWSGPVAQVRQRLAGLAAARTPPAGAGR